MKKIKSNKIFFAFFIFVIILIFLYCNENKYPKEIVGGSYLPDVKDAKKMSKKERQQLEKKEIDESKFTLSIYPFAYFKSGESEGNIYVRNEIDNVYPISVSVVEDETDEVIYESGAIKPGYEVTKGKLTKAFLKGSYNCTANVSIFDPKTKMYRGQTAAQLEVIVEN